MGINVMSIMTRIIYYHNDHLGSASVITDENGDVLEETTYDPWGSIETGGTTSKFLYTGQEYDAETGLNYYNARYYSADLRRFTQPDNYIQDIYNPQMLNRYSYTLNNPLRYTDPSGHNPFAIGGGLIAAIAGLPEEAVIGAAVVVGVAVSAVIFPQQTATIINTAKSFVGNILHPTTTVQQKPTSSAPPRTSSPPSNSTPSGNKMPSPQVPKGSIIAGAAGAVNAVEQEIQVHGNGLRSTVTTWGYTLRNAAGE